MGIDTRGFLNPEITATDIYNMIVSKFDNNAIFDIEINKYDSTERGSINFNYKEEKRNLFYCVVRDKIEGTEFDDGRLHVTLSLGMWGSSVEIMTEIVKEFGGYVDENDCDDENAFYVPKDGNLNYDNFIAQRNKIVELLDEGLNKFIKIQVANQILKHKDKIMTLLNCY